MEGRGCSIFSGSGGCFHDDIHIEFTLECLFRRSIRHTVVSGPNYMEKIGLT